MSAAPTTSSAPTHRLERWQADLLVAGSRFGQQDASPAAAAALPWIAAWLSHLEESLSGILARPARATPSARTSIAEVASRASYHLGIGGTEEAPLIRVCADDAACRALCNPLLRDVATLRGVGGLSDPEYGVLDYLVAELLDELSRRIGAPLLATPSAIGRDAREAGEELAGDVSSLRIPVTIGVGAARGHLLVAIRGSSLIGLPPSVRKGVSKVARPEDRIRLRLALPPIELPESEARSLAPGDLLLLPMGSLAGSAGGLALVADPGVEVASVDVTNDCPSVTSLSIDRIALQLRAIPVREGSILIQPLIGVVEPSVERILSWAPGTPIDLTKPEGSTVVELRSASGVLRRPCEVVRFDGQLALRLLASPAAALAAVHRKED